MKANAEGGDTLRIHSDHESMRILAIDIETAPNLAWVWGIWDQNINLEALVEHQHMLCWVAKWVGEPEVEFRSIYHDGQDEMILRAWELLDAADAVLHFNGRRFDVPHLNREFLRLHLTPPSPYKQIDLLQVAKKEFAFASNKLAHVLPQLGLDGKVHHTGFGMWKRCMADDPEAWDEMRTYNMRDVTGLEEAYYILRPWVRSHPSVAALKGKDVCPACGSEHLQSRGTTFLRTGTYPRFQCVDCGKWSRGTHRVDKTETVEVPNT